MDVEEATQKVSEMVDHLGNPDHMSKDQYAELLESVIADCEAKLEGVEQELAEERQGD